MTGLLHSGRRRQRCRSLGANKRKPDAIRGYVSAKSLSMPKHRKAQEPKLPRVVVVTGAGRGIGRAIALALAGSGVKVGVLARSSAEIGDTADLARGTGVDAWAIAADVADAGDVKAAMERFEEILGPIEGLINNAGILGPIAPFWEAPVSAWERTVAVDLLGPAICAHAVLPRMIERRCGRIINVATSMIPTPHYSAYGAAKAGLVRFSETLAAELRPHGVSVFAMTPGTTRTAMSMHSLNSAEGKRWIPGFARIFEEGLDVPMERPVGLALALLSGQFDLLSGRLVTPHDDLLSLKGHAKQIQEEDLYVLRVRSFPSAVAERLGQIRRSDIANIPLLANRRG